MRYIPYHELGDIPNIIVDGEANAYTLLTLSHWPHSQTPKELLDDLSAQIVFNYLDRSDLHINVDIVSNNHFDEDGLISVYTLLNPEIAQQHRELLIDIAAAGDFGTYKFREAARIAFIISAFADANSSPLPSEIFNLSYPETTAALYREMLLRLPEIIANPENFRDYWQRQEEWLNVSETAIRNGRIKIIDIPNIDLAVVTIPEKDGDCHPMALHNSTGCFCILLIQGRKYQLQYRYESWVQYISVKVRPRIDLQPLAAQLSAQETRIAHWQFDGVTKITPRLHLVGTEESRISPDSFILQVKNFLAIANGY